MLNVILCDDDPKVIKLLKKFIEGYSMMEELDDINIELATGDPLKVLELFRANVEQADGQMKQVARSLKHRLLYLDVDLGELGKERHLDGISLAREIRKFDVGADISFLTHNRMTISDVLNYKIAPLAFLSKPFIHEDQGRLQAEVIDVLKHAYERMSKSTVDKKVIGFKTGKRTIYVNLVDVYYLQGNKSKNEEGNKSDMMRSGLTTLYEAGGTQYLKQSLAYYERQIPELVRLGKSHLINPSNVKETKMTGRSVTVKMRDDSEIQVTRKAHDDFEALINME